MKNERFGRYQVISKIATGGMAEIYRARSSSGKLVAIKKIHSSFTSSKKFITMFVDEAKIMVSLKHPNVVQIYEFGLIDDEYFLTMEWVDGRPLSSLIRRQINLGVVYPVDLAVFVILEICCGLEYAHQKKDSYNQPLNLIHRDLSPPNIFISREGDVKIGDFGIAKARGKVSLTQPGILKGKFSYMSPEQARGEDIDQRSDIFSTGIMLHELLTGRRLFLSDKDTETIENVRRAKVIRPSRINPEVSEALDFICLKALAKKKGKRYQTASEFAGDLEYLLQTSFPGTNSATLKSFMQFLYPNVTIFTDEPERKGIIDHWSKRLHAGRTMRDRRSQDGYLASGSLPSWNQGLAMQTTRPGFAYYAILCLVFLFSSGMIFFDCQKRRPHFKDRLASQSKGAMYAGKSPSAHAYDIQ